MKRPIDRIVECMPSQAELARQMGVTPGFITKLLKHGRIPAERCPQLERITRGKVKAAQMRPDVFGKKAGK